MQKLNNLHNVTIIEANTNAELNTIIRKANDDFNHNEAGTVRRRAEGSKDLKYIGPRGSAYYFRHINGFRGEVLADLYFGLLNICDRQLKKLVSPTGYSYENIYIQAGSKEDNIKVLTSIEVIIENLKSMLDNKDVLVVDMTSLKILTLIAISKYNDTGSLIRTSIYYMIDARLKLDKLDIAIFKVLSGEYKLDVDFFMYNFDFDAINKNKYNFNLEPK